MNRIAGSGEYEEQVTVAMCWCGHGFTSAVIEMPCGLALRVCVDCERKELADGLRERRLTELTHPKHPDMWVKELKDEHYRMSQSVRYWRNEAREYKADYLRMRKAYIRLFIESEK